MLRRDGHCRVQPHHLKADLVDHFGNGRIDLARHDRRSGLHGRQLDLVDARARAHHHDAQVAGDLAQVDREDAHRRAEPGHVTHALHELDPVFSHAQLETGDGAQVLDGKRWILLLDRHARAHRASPNAEIAEVVGRFLHAANAAIQRTGIGGEFLSQPDGHCVLQVRATGLHHVVELVPLRAERVAQALEGLDERGKLR